MHASIESFTDAAPKAAQVRRWRVVDIVVASVIGVASGVIFWAWGIGYAPFDTALAFSPGLSGVLNGGWLFAGVIGALVVRKPGAALYTELVAAVVEMLIGNSWGFSSVIWGLFEGAGAEIVFALFLYRHWRLGAALLAGAGAGLFNGLLDTMFSSYAAWAIGYKAFYVLCSVVSGLVVAGLLGWLAVRALAATGALSRFAAGREARTVELPDDAA